MISTPVRMTSWLLLALLWPGVRASDGALRLPDDPPPPALASIEPLQGALAIALTEDGGQAAVAFRHPDRDRSTALHMASAGEPVRVSEIRGTVIDLLFTSSGETLLALVQRGKPGRARESFLYTVDLASLDGTRAATLPSTAAALDLWPAGNSLLVACQNEVRTIQFPDLRSGPLFSIRGGNLSLAAVPGGDSVLIGQSESISRYDLGDPQGRQAMSARERLSMPAPVVALVAAPDGRSALARLEDGRTFRLDFDPLRPTKLGDSTFIAWLGHPIAPRPAPVTLERPPPVEATGAAEAAAPDDAPSSPTPGPAPPAPASDDAPSPADEQTAALAQSTDSSRGELEGSIGGPGASWVRAVVLLGPDNIMREATRVEPLEQGRWKAANLAPGRYRIVLDGEEGRTLAVDPQFLTVTVEAGVRTTAQPFKVLGER